MQNETRTGTLPGCDDAIRCDGGRPTDDDDAERVWVREEPDDPAANGSATGATEGESPGTATGTADREPAAQKSASDSDDGMDRRVLLGGIGAAAVGGWFLFLRDDSDSPEDVVETYFAAIDDNDPDQLREVIHTGSSGWEDAQDIDREDMEDINVEVRSVEEIDRTDGRATVEAHLTIELEVFGQMQERDDVQSLELRQEDGQWRIWNE